MIVISVSLDGVSVDGHAGYSEMGKDILCAAVSALTQSLIHSLEALTEDKITSTIVSGCVNIKFRNLSEAGKLLVDSFFIAISDLQQTYGDEFIKIT